MEWYFGNDVDDLVVPKNQEPLDRLPSPDSWSQWGIATLGSHESPKKNFNGKNFCDNADIRISGNEREWSSSMCHGSQNGSLQWTPLSNEQPDYQLNDLARIDQMEDIFFSSLLEEDDSSTENLHGSSSFSARSNYSIMSADNFLTDMMLDSQYVPSHTYGMGSSNYLKTHAFSPLVEWENGEVATSCTPLKVPVVNNCAPSGQNSMSGYMDEETSTEESVLQELGRVTSQLTEKTRTCFRDSLYRLAENSKQQIVNPSQNGDISMEECHPMMVDETLRPVKTESTELKTNAIDRAVANLMFNKMHDDHLAAEVSLNMEQEGNGTTGPRFNQTQSTILAGDAEVPMISHEKLLAGFRGSAVNM